MKIPRRARNMLMGAMCACLLAGFVGLGSSDALGATLGGAIGDPRADLVAPNFPASTPLPIARAWLANALSLRAKQLTSLDAKTSASTTLGPADAVALSSLLESETKGTEALVVQLSSATDLNALQAAAASMVLDLHVFALVTPEVNGVIATDADLAQGRELVGDEPAIAVAIVAGQQANDNMRQAKRLLDVFTTNLSRLQGDLNGLPGELLQLVSGDLPDALPVLASAHRALLSANDMLRCARGRLATIVALLASSGRPPKSDKRDVGHTGDARSCQKMMTRRDQSTAASSPSI